MHSIKLLLAVTVVAASSFAHADVNFSTIQVSSGQFTPLPYPETVTFDSALPAGIYYSGGRLVTGTAWDLEYTTPTYDTTSYLAVGNAAPTASVTFDAGMGASYFGFYLGTPDSYNSVTFNGSDGSHTTIDGYQLVNYSAQSPTGSFYLGVQSTSGTVFTSIVFHSDGDSMETDNHAYVLAAAVPEPETYAMLLGGLGLMGFIARRRRSRG